MSPGDRVLLGLGRDVIGRELRPLAEEELLALLPQDLLRLGRHQVETVFIDQHLRVLEPQLPRLLRDVLEDALPERVVERLPLDAFGLAAELDAFDGAGHPDSLGYTL